MSPEAVHRRFVFVIAAVALLLGACDQKAFRDRFFPGSAEQFAKSYLALFAERNFQAIEATINPVTKGPELRANLEKVAASFPPERPKNVVVIGRHIVEDHGSREIALSLQYEFSNFWVLANVALHETAEGFLVDGTYVHQRPEPLENLNDVTLADKNVRHYALLAAAILVALFSLLMLIQCLRMPGLSWKWLWAFVIVTSVGRVTLNWTTGELSFDPLNALLFGASAWRETAYAPVMLSVAMPLGALLFSILYGHVPALGKFARATGGSHRRKRGSKRGKTRIKGRPLAV
ncbi:MAG: hypothetical protein ACJ8NR_05035 [Sulfurifustis sp.]